MTEETPQNPVSEKGKVRKQISDKIIQEIAKGNIKGLIARSADFYDPSVKNASMLTEMYNQYDKDYVFKRSKFETKFNFKPTPFINGIKEIIQKDYI